MTDTTAKKDTQKLQRAIVDGLEDVKAQDIRVFNTEHLSPLFERVIVASGTSNRQTKALAASVRDKVRDAGFVKPRMEGEENGEWIIVDCGAAVAHIMQPSIRQYYNLEEIWGEKPVRLKFGAPKPVAPAKPEPKAAVKAPAKKAAAKRAPARSAGAAAKPAAKTAKPAAKVAKPAAKAAAVKSAVKKAPAKAAPAKKVAVKKVTVNEAAAKKAPAKKAVARKAAPAKRPAAKKSSVKKA